jgi:O-antigen/teichoic acid export membrane protein
VFILAQTIGLWFVNNILSFPQGRMSDVIFVYRLSIFSLLFTIITSPFNALIMSHEDMHIYACLSIIEAVLKLGIVLILQLIATDKLRLYGLLTFAVVAINTVICITICMVKYKVKIYFYGKPIKEIIGFSAWNLFGPLASIFKSQIINILLNQFFNPVVVAARGISLSINSAVYSFAINFNVAMGPPLIKAYAAGKSTEILLFRSVKFSFFLVYIFILPLVMEMPFVLLIWLKNPPEYAVAFSRLILIDLLIDAIGNQFGSVAQATGRIRLYQSVGNAIVLLNVPASYIVLSLGYPPYSVMFVSIILTFISLFARLIIVGQLIDFSLQHFFLMVTLPIIIVLVLSPIIPLLLYNIMQESLLRFFFVFGTSSVIMILLIFTIGMSRAERQMILSSIYGFLGKKVFARS